VPGPRDFDRSSITEVSQQPGGRRERWLTDVLCWSGVDWTGGVATDGRTDDNWATVKLNREAWIDQFLAMIVALVLDAVSSSSIFRRRESHLLGVDED